MDTPIENDESALVNLSMSIPSEYQQEEGTVQNSCVWLSACLAIRSVDLHLSTKLLKQYQDDPFFLSGCTSSIKGHPIIKYCSIICDGHKSVMLMSGDLRHPKITNQYH